MSYESMLDEKIICGYCNESMCIEYSSYPAHELPVKAFCTTCGFTIKITEASRRKKEVKP